MGNRSVSVNRQRVFQVLKESAVYLIPRVDAALFVFMFDFLCVGSVAVVDSHCPPLDIYIKSNTPFF